MERRYCSPLVEVQHQLQQKQHQKQGHYAIVRWVAKDVHSYREDHGHTPWTDAQAKEWLKGMRAARVGGKEYLQGLQRQIHKALTK